ncbi:putative regulatory protein [Vibrio phage 1.244.A._10N.261.54.C3]|nr:putative regulatory protein [Vibrio phage 1.244.A._10N.261.54.C3]AUR98696.1 putative regulatory protein [Vibrio phage 1.255.O._10N.286.45.F1]
MPTYNYGCGKCDHTFKAFRSIKERKEPEQYECPECGVTAVQMLMSAPKVVSGVTTEDKVPQGFKDILSGIKKSSDKECTIDV